MKDIQVDVKARIFSIVTELTKSESKRKSLEPLGGLDFRMIIDRFQTDTMALVNLVVHAHESIGRQKLKEHAASLVKIVEDETRSKEDWRQQAISARREKEEALQKAA